MTTLRTAHTADLTRAELAAVRALLDDAFEGDFSDEDWDHGLGGIHVCVQDNAGVFLAHGSVVQRRVLHAGRSYRVGYVEAVAVRADARRRGLGGQVMAALERVVEGAYAFGALSASEEGATLYTARGWQVWPGRIAALSPSGIHRMREEEGTTFLWPGRAELSPPDELVFDWRDGDVL
ncbi:GNAT family N-acetyltransferase [Streptomyces sp. NBC_01304]|uniref:GNAT family N-acetyltransferase n=1 Tax=Streptomyces sp. NBC_01304 TaxID=2903818 RepID=UPI002E0F95F9|nr:GNAT family N-acetyltransferase [Streptomyces sp. NBC_01304]